MFLAIKKKCFSTNRIYNIVYDNKIKEHDFGDVYIISEYYPADLSKIIRSG